MNHGREHLDAETVAAWIDGGLDAASVAAAETHAADCDRCQALLATVVRTLPADASAETKSKSPSIRGFWKWLAPLGAAAAAVTLWMVVPQDPMRPSSTAAPRSDAAQVAPAAPEPLSAPVAQPAPAPPAAQVTAAAPASGADARFADAAPASRRQESPAGKLADSQAKIAAAPKETRSRQEKLEAAEEKATASAATPSMPASAPAPAPVFEAASPRAAVGADTNAQLRKQAAPFEIVSPDPQRRWRVAGGSVEHSSDGGRTWAGVRQATGEAITAGSAPSDEVCWLAGRAGVVLLAIDGRNFARLPFPQGVDLVAIAARDARRATVTTADGRIFLTEDGGQNWRNP